MHPPVIALIEWISAAEGGRTQPPRGRTYSAVARFETQEERWTENAWSLVLEFFAPPDSRLPQVAKVRFLVECGPTDWFKVGAKFELLEGSKVVAKGTVLPEPYDPAKFKEGAAVRVVDRAALEEFDRTWKLHNPLQPEQLEHAGKVTRVKQSSMYHGGDILYLLEGLPGIWHECCVESA